MLHRAGAAREAAGRAEWAPGTAPAREVRGSAAEPDPNGERRSSAPGEKQEPPCADPRLPTFVGTKSVEKENGFRCERGPGADGGQVPCICMLLL